MKKKPKKSKPRSIHPFPARMAPDLAFKKLRKRSTRSYVLDPMAGSGTVLRQAADLGMRARGFDLDPLAVLMSRVATTCIQHKRMLKYLSEFIKEVEQLGAVYLPWIDEDNETKKFVNYWFGLKQRRGLRRLAFALQTRSRRASKSTARMLDVLKIAFSRLIITKERGASLARDVSHSRPHKVIEKSDYEVIPSFIRSVTQLCYQLKSTPPMRRCKVDQGDARSLRKIKSHSVDIVMTSPPYLNAIDYMRGHRLSLVWLGYKFSELRKIRSDSIGAERGPQSSQMDGDLRKIQSAMGKLRTFHRDTRRWSRAMPGIFKE